MGGLCYHAWVFHGRPLDLLCVGRRLPEHGAHVQITQRGSHSHRDHMFRDIEPA